MLLNSISLLLFYNVVYVFNVLEECNVVITVAYQEYRTIHKLRVTLV